MKRYLAAILKRLDKAGLMGSINFSTTCKIRDRIFKIPILNGIGYQLIIPSEEWAIILYDKLLTLQSGTFIDVGANNGQTTLKVAALQSNLSYIGFEPNPGCFYYLNNLIKKNKLSGCNIYPVGLYTANKILTLYSDNNFASGASILENFRENKDRYNIRQNIPVIIGDDIILGLNLSKISIIKADVEGAELEVLQGLQQTILKYQPFIVIEILPVYNIDKENGRYRKERQDQLLLFMKSQDYILFRINEQDISLTRLEDIAVHSNMNETNYLYVPRHKLEEVTNSF